MTLVFRPGTAITKGRIPGFAFQLPTTSAGRSRCSGKRFALKRGTLQSGMMRYHPSRQVGWRDKDWFRTRLPDQTPRRPQCIQSPYNLYRRTHHLSCSATSRTDFHPYGWAAGLCQTPKNSRLDSTFARRGRGAARNSGWLAGPRGRSAQILTGWTGCVSRLGGLPSLRIGAATLAT